MSQSVQKIGFAGCVTIGLALCAQSALAQSSNGLTIYGAVDAGLEYIQGVSSGGTKENVSRVTGGNQYASRWGLRGTEDLGGGLKAVFNLEDGYNPDTGTTLQGGRLFGRASVVGLEGSWGSLMVGRQRNTIFDLMLTYDPMPYLLYGVTTLDNSFFAQRPDNSVKYSYKSGGLSGSLLYSFGRDALAGTPAGSQSEVPGNSRVGRQTGANLNYATGPLSIGFGYDQEQGVTVATARDSDRRYLLAATYELAATRTTLLAGVVRRQNDVPAVHLTSDITWIGVRQPITGPWGMAAHLSRASQHDSENKATFMGATLFYDLSKRTELYLDVAHATNKGASTQGVTPGITAAPGQAQSGIVSGILHRF
jgi:predicted porin